MEPASTAKAPLRVDLFASRYAFSAFSSPAVAAPVATSCSLKLLPRTEAAPSYRGWMFPVPGVAMKMTMSPPPGRSALIWFPIACPDRNSAWPT